jgi:uncharacterized membrane protein
MKLQFKIALFSMAFHVTSLIIDFDTALLVLLIIFTVFALICVFSGKLQTLNVIWLFSGLITIAYAIFYAYTTIPNSEFNALNIFVAVLKLVGGLSGVIATTFALELKYE